MAQVFQATQAAVLTRLKVPFAQFVHTVLVVAVPVVVKVVPSGQVLQTAHVRLFSTELKLPAAQSLHVRSVFVVPCVPTDLPAMHVVMLTQGVAAVPSSSQVPAGQVTGRLVPPMQEEPAAQGVHTGGADCVPATVWYVPGAQAPGAVHSARFGVSATVPAAHAAQVRSTLEEGVLVMCVPATQSVQGAQVAWFCKVENVPEAQPVQTWSTLSEPGVSTYEPGLQVVQATQLGLFFSGAKKPGAHATHTLSWATPPATATKVPAAQSDAATHSVAGSRSLSNVPAAQSTGSASPPAQ